MTAHAPAQHAQVMHVRSDLTRCAVTAKCAVEPAEVSDPPWGDVTDVTDVRCLARVEVLPLRECRKATPHRDNNKLRTRRRASARPQRRAPLSKTSTSKLAAVEGKTGCQIASNPDQLFASNNGSDSISMKLTGGLVLFPRRNLRHAHRISDFVPCSQRARRRKREVCRRNDRRHRQRRNQCRGLPFVRKGHDGLPARVGAFRHRWLATPAQRNSLLSSHGDLGFGCGPRRSDCSHSGKAW